MSCHATVYVDLRVLHQSGHFGGAIAGYAVRVRNKCKEIRAAIERGKQCLPLHLSREKKADYDIFVYRDC